MEGEEITRAPRRFYIVRDGKVDGETQIKFAGQDQWQPLAESPLARAVPGS